VKQYVKQINIVLGCIAPSDYNVKGINIGKHSGITQSVITKAQSRRGGGTFVITFAGPRRGYGGILLYVHWTFSVARKNSDHARGSRCWL